MSDIAASVLAKLKNKAKASGISYQQCLQLFFQEEFLRRLAGSKAIPHRKNVPKPAECHIIQSWINRR